MNESDGPISLVVGFDRAFLWRTIRGMAILCLFFSAGFLFVVFDPPSGFNKSAIMKVTILVLAPLLVAVLAAFGIQAIGRLRGKKTALVIDDAGLTIGFSIGKGISLTWPEIARIYLKEGARPEASLLCVEGSDPATLMQRVTWLQRLNSQMTGARCPICIGVAALDTPWVMIKEAVGDRTVVQDSPPSGQSVVDDRTAAEMIRNVEATLKSRTTLGGKLITLDDYREHFRKNLIGSWSPSDLVFSYSPVDQWFAFYADGTGIFTSGPFHHGNLCLWREESDWRIQVRMTENDPWASISYTFSEIDGVPTLRWTIGDSDETADSDETESVGDFFDIMIDGYHFGGLPRGATARADGQD